MACDSILILDFQKWAVNRQMRYEGGFQGRTNKLVDGCYSFWQGATIPIIQALIQQNGTQILLSLSLSTFHLTNRSIIYRTVPWRSN